MKKLIAVLIILIPLICCSTPQKGKTPEEIEELLLRVDSLSFEELKTEIRVSADQFEAMMGIIRFVYEDRGTPERIAEDDVSTTDEKTFIPVQLSDSLLSKIMFGQEIGFESSDIGLDLSELSIPDWVDADVWLDKLYYADSTMDTSSIHVGGKASVKTTKRIDSLKVLLRVSYPVDVTRVVLSAVDNKVQKDSGEIRINKIEDNLAQVVMSRKISGRYLDMQAIDSENRFLSSSSSMQGGYPAEKEIDFYNLLSKTMKELSENIDNDKYKTKEELKAALIGYASKLDYNESSEFSVKQYYRGNVDKVVVYYAGKMEYAEYQITLHRNADSFKDRYILVSNNSDRYGLLDVVSGKFIIEPSLPNLRKVNECYYAYFDYYNSYLYRFDSELKQMIEVKGYDASEVRALNDELLIVNENDYVGVLDSKGNLIIPMQFEKIAIDADDPYKVHLLNEDGERSVRQLKTVK